jgi:hypothetical protein
VGWFVLRYDPPEGLKRVVPASSVLLVDIENKQHDTTRKDRNNDFIFILLTSNSDNNILSFKIYKFNLKKWKLEGN